MASNRDEFSSRLGFIMAASGSAIGLGNIWGFPGQVAQNGGAAFVLVYIILSFVIAYPSFMAELIIGRYTGSNIVGAFSKIPNASKFRFVGYAGLVTASLILSFYTIVAGWIVSYMFEALFMMFGFTKLAEWCITNSVERSIIFAILFSGLTIFVVAHGVKDGIEKWSTRLMPILLFILVAMSIYIITQDGAIKGLQVYLVPDFSKIGNPQLILSALGQAFFSLSLGVGTMLVYGSYLRKSENLPQTGVLVTLSDVGIAFIAGALIIPSMYVAKANGIQIFSEDGSLIAGSNIVFQVLPALFDSFGGLSFPLSFIFFSLMTIAALTSSISMLEVPVSHFVDDLNTPRKKASIFSGFFILTFSIIVILNFDFLFGLVVSISTKYMEPLIGVFLCIFVGWIMKRNQLLNELKQGFSNVEYSFFFKVWPWFVRIICPILIIVVFIHSFF